MGGWTVARDTGPPLIEIFLKSTPLNMGIFYNRPVKSVVDVIFFSNIIY